jgi:AcrR family transcriptional regulator
MWYISAMPRKPITVPAATPPPSVPPAAAKRQRGDAPAQLLDAAVRVLLEQGLGDGSLRSMAARLGTSHRMLSYHFGGMDGFWDAVLEHIRSQELAAWPALLAPSSVDAADLEAHLVAAWQRFSAPQYLPVMQLLFELYGRAIHDRARFGHFLDAVVARWLEPLTVATGQALGCDAPQAQARARLAVAGMRGLLLDLITTGDRAGTTAAMRLLAQAVVRVDIGKMGC